MVSWWPEAEPLECKFISPNWRNLKYADDYYAFTNLPGISIRIPLSDFTDNLDLKKDVLCSVGNERDGYRAPPVVEVSSAKSGFKLVFDTNHKSSTVPLIVVPWYFWLDIL